MKATEINFVKLNIVHLKKGKRVQNTQNLREFFEGINKKIKGTKIFEVKNQAQGKYL